MMNTEKREDASSEPLEALSGSIRLLGTVCEAMLGLCWALLGPLPFRKRLCGRTLWPELGHAIGPCVPRVGLESLRGTRGGRKRKWRRGRNKEEEEEASWEPLDRF